MSTEETAQTSDRIVVGVDGSKPSHEALRWARFMADVTGSTLEAIMVWQRISAYGAGAAGWAAFPPDWNPAEEARRVLADTVAEVFGPSTPEGMTMTVREGGAAHALIEMSGGARMLVVGSRGHGGFAGLLLGSVSTACAEHATCPVLVIHGMTPPPPSRA
ncbi:MAG: universal stress protein [Jatrophihabitantaceae bacterium]